MACTSVLTQPSVTLRVCVYVCLTRQGAKSPTRLIHKRSGLLHACHRTQRAKNPLREEGWTQHPPRQSTGTQKGKSAHPLVQLTPSFSPISHTQTQKHTTGTRINPREDHNRRTCPPVSQPGPIQVLSYSPS